MFVQAFEIMAVEDDVEPGVQRAVDHRFDPLQPGRIDGVGGGACGMAVPAHRDAHRLESRRGDVAEIGIADPRTAPAIFGGRFEMIADIDAWPDRQAVDTVARGERGGT